MLETLKAQNPIAGPVQERLKEGEGGPGFLEMATRPLNYLSVLYSLPASVAGDVLGGRPAEIPKDFLGGLGALFDIGTSPVNVPASLMTGHDVSVSNLPWIRESDPARAYRGEEKYNPGVIAEYFQKKNAPDYQQLSFEEKVPWRLAGLALDTAGDPLTYLTFGIGKAAKFAALGLAKEATVRIGADVAEDVAAQAVRESAEELGKDAARYGVKAVGEAGWAVTENGKPLLGQAAHDFATPLARRVPGVAAEAPYEMIFNQGYKPAREFAESIGRYGEWERLAGQGSRFWRGEAVLKSYEGGARWSPPILGRLSAAGQKTIVRGKAVQEIGRAVSQAMRATTETGAAERPFLKALAEAGAKLGQLGTRGEAYIRQGARQGLEPMSPGGQAALIMGLRGVMARGGAIEELTTRELARVMEETGGTEGFEAIKPYLWARDRITEFSDQVANAVKAGEKLPVMDARTTQARTVLETEMPKFSDADWARIKAYDDTWARIQSRYGEAMGIAPPTRKAYGFPMYPDIDKMKAAGLSDDAVTRALRGQRELLTDAENAVADQFGLPKSAPEARGFIARGGGDLENIDTNVKRMFEGYARARGRDVEDVALVDLLGELGLSPKAERISTAEVTAKGIVDRLSSTIAGSDARAFEEFSRLADQVGPDNALDAALKMAGDDPDMAAKLMTQFGERAESVRGVRRAVDLLAEAGGLKTAKMDVALKTLEDLEGSRLVIPEGYTQLGKAGFQVDKARDVADRLVADSVISPIKAYRDAVHFSAKINKPLSKLMRMWREFYFSRPGFHIRNQVSDYITAVSSGLVGPVEYANEIARLYGSSAYREALWAKYGDKVAAIIGQDIGSPARLRLLQAGEATEPVSKWTAEVGAKIREAGIPTPTSVFAWEDNATRMAFYKLLRESRGMSHDQAVALTQYVLKDYAELSKLMKNIRAWVAPFAAWKVQNLAFQWELFKTSPGLYIHLYMGLPEALSEPGTTTKRQKLSGAIGLPGGGVIQPDLPSRDFTELLGIGEPRDLRETAGGIFMGPIVGAGESALALGLKEGEIPKSRRLAFAALSALPFGGALGSGQSIAKYGPEGQIISNLTGLSYLSPEKQQKLVKSEARQYAEDILDMNRAQLQEEQQQGIPRGGGSVARRATTTGSLGNKRLGRPSLSTKKVARGRSLETPKLGRRAGRNAPIRLGS